MAIDELAPGSSHERQARAAAWAGGAGSGGRGGARPQGERMSILGIDPGKSGAVAAVLDEGGELLKVHDTPSTLEPNGRSATNAPLLASILARSHARIAYGEFVGARPTDAKVAAFAFGRARGVIEGCSSDDPANPTREGDAMTRRPYAPQAAAASIHHRMPLTSAADNPDNHYTDYISDNPERDVTSIAVEVDGVVHLGHYSTRSGMIRVTYGSSCKATQLGGMENAQRASRPG